MKSQDDRQEGKQIDPDEAMLSLSSFVEEIADVDGYIMEDNGIFSMDIEQLTLGMPIQMDIQTNEYGNVTLESSPPLYYVETSFMPVFHQLRLRVEVNNNNE